MFIFKCALQFLRVPINLYDVLLKLIKKVMPLTVLQ